EIDAWRKRQRCLPKSPMGKALGYMNDNWAGLTAFLDDPDLPLGRVGMWRGARQGYRTRFHTPLIEPYVRY
ncbi:IS66 family transposase, partial [Acanthopleuribacter pedis]